MHPTLYLADTCSLRNAYTRSSWERDFFPKPDFKLTILFTVRCELELQKKGKEAKAALEFMKEHADRFILLPEQDGYAAGSAADREIFYHCALRQNADIVLFTEDKKLAADLLDFNPIARIHRTLKTTMVLVVSSWRKIYAQLAKRHVIYLTAGCVNSPTFTSIMKQRDIAALFCGGMVLSTASLPLLSEEGRAILRKLEEQELAPVLRGQGRIFISEKDELLARLQTHSGTRPAMLWLGEKEQADDYLELSRKERKSLKHIGYAVAVLRGNGRLEILQEVEEPTQQEEIPTAPAKAEKMELPPAPAEPHHSPAPQQPSPLAPENTVKALKAPVRDLIISGKIAKAASLIRGRKTLKVHAVNTCLTEKPDMLHRMVTSLHDHGESIPSACLVTYVCYVLPKTAEELKQHFQDKVFVGHLTRFVKNMEPLSGHKNALATLRKRYNIADDETKKVLQRLINCVVSKEATASK